MHPLSNSEKNVMYLIWMYSICHVDLLTYIVWKLPKKEDFLVLTLVLVSFVSNLLPSANSSQTWRWRHLHKQLPVLMLFIWKVLTTSTAKKNNIYIGYYVNSFDLFLISMSTTHNGLLFLLHDNVLWRNMCLPDVHIVSQVPV